MKALDLTLPLADGRKCVWRGCDFMSQAYLRTMAYYMSLELSASGDTGEEPGVCRLSWPAEKNSYDFFWNMGIGANRNVRTGAFDLFIRRLGWVSYRTVGFLFRQIFHLGIVPLLSGDVILAHGVLIEKNRCGALVLGVSGMGKSTFARRLNPPWSTPADDCILICRKSGRYFAQPIPTWSLWYAENPPPPRRFDCGKFFPVEKVFLLARGNEVEASLLKSRSGLMPEASNSIMNFANLATDGMPDDLRHRVMTATFDFGYKMAEDLDFYRLVTPLNRPFQDELDRVFEAPRGGGF